MFSCEADSCPSCPHLTDREIEVKLDEALAGKSRDNMPVIYVSGPMTGREDFNFPRFNDVSRKLRFLGFHVLNPADFGNDPKHTWEQCLARDLQLVAHADVILLLEGWDQSKGAGLEFDTAVGLGKPAVTEECFAERVVARFFDEDELSDLLDLDDFRQARVVARFGGVRSEIITREDAKKYQSLNDAIAAVLEGLADAED